MAEKKQHIKSEQEIQEEYKLIVLASMQTDKFELLYNEYFNEIFAFIYKRTCDTDITGDITSNVFLKAMLNLKTYKFRGIPFSAWLYRIAVNEVNSYFRETKKERTISIEESNIENLLHDVGISDNLEEKSEIIINLLSELPDKKMQLIELRFFENRSYEEIAQILAISISSAKVKVHRILNKFKNKIEAAKNKISTFLFLYV